MKRLARMGWFAMSAALCVAAASAQARTQTWNFRVYLDDAAIGHHRFAVSENGVSREMTTEVRFDVKVLFINAYRYVHDASERWQGNCLTNLNARTDDNGKQSIVSAARQGDRVSIDSPRGVEAVQAKGGCVMSFAYWNPAILRQTHLLNSQTGQYEAVTIAALGEEKITVRGAPVQATRYRISGPKNPIDLWYGSDQSWLALQSTLDGGRKLRYLLK